MTQLNPTKTVFLALLAMLLSAVLTLQVISPREITAAAETAPMASESLLVAPERATKNPVHQHLSALPHHNHNAGVLLSPQALQQQIEHDRRHHGKPGAEVFLEGRQTFTLEAGQAKTVTLKLRSDNTSDKLWVDIQPSPGLTLISATQQWQLDLSEKQQLVLPVEVMAHEDGEHYLHLYVTQRNAEGQLSTRALASAFKLGEQAQDLVHYYKSEHSHKAGPTYRSMPAQETIY